MSLICSKCRESFRFAGNCPTCQGSGGDCRSCYGTGRHFVCGCDGVDALARAEPAPPIIDSPRQRTRPITPPKPEELSTQEIAARARERRGAPRRNISFDHDFRDGRCTICGKLEMLAGRHGWSCG